MKKKITMFCVVLLSLLVQTHADAQKIILRPDLAVTNITATNINGNSVTFTYDVKNVGNANLELSRLYFQTYVSTNSTYETSDLAAGGAIFGNSAPVLTPGQTYTNSWTSGNTSGIQVSHYLIFQVKLRSGYVAQETNLTNNTFSKNLTPSFADLAVTNIAVNSINGNSVDFSFTITNLGSTVLYLDRFYFQTYVSQNSLYDAADSPAGVAVFSSSVLTLNPGASYTGSWTSNASVSLAAYPYLMFDVRLLSGQVHPQVSLTNDRYVKYLPFSFTDLAVNSIVTNTFNPTTSVNFTYTVSNNGQTDLNLNQFYFQTYLSTNAVYDNLDKPAGGSVFPANVVLSTNQTYSGSWTSSAGVNIQSYPYLIFIVKTVYGTLVHEASYSNNQYIKQVPFVFESFQKSLSKSAAFIVENKEEVLTLENGIDIDQQTSYIIYSIAGETISEGSFDVKKEINTGTLKNGIYLLQLSNGSEHESVKFVVQN